MRCNPLALGALADGELRGVLRWRLLRHLAHCPRCRAELTELRTLTTLLSAASPLPARPTVHRPIGLVRPAVALVAMACAAGVFLRGAGPEPARQGPVRLPAPPVLQAVAQPTPLPKTLAVPPQKVARHKTRHRRHFSVARARARRPTEQVIVIATVLPPPEPVTVVLDDRDDDGGTIHIESTIPAAYVVALQKESE